MRSYAGCLYDRKKKNIRIARQDLTSSQVSHYDQQLTKMTGQNRFQLVVLYGRYYLFPRFHVSFEQTI